MALSFIVAGHYNFFRADQKYKEVQFGFMVTISHRRFLFNEIARRCGCEQEQLGIEKMSADPLNPKEEPRIDLERLLDITVAVHRETLDISEVECDSVNASVILDETYVLVLDEYLGDFTLILFHPDEGTIAKKKTIVATLQTDVDEFLDMAFSSLSE